MSARKGGRGVSTGSIAWRQSNAPDLRRFTPGFGLIRLTFARPTLEVEGRCDDVLDFHDARGRPLVLSSLALATVLEDEGGVFDFDLLQARDGALRLTLHGPAAAQRRLAHSALQGWLRGQGVADLRLVTRAVRAAGRRGASGKRCRILRDAPH